MDMYETLSDRDLLMVIAKAIGSVSHPDAGYVQKRLTRIAVAVDPHVLESFFKDVEVERYKQEAESANHRTSSIQNNCRHENYRVTLHYGGCGYDCEKRECIVCGHEWTHQERM